jgi:hypothetical protein
MKPTPNPSVTGSKMDAAGFRKTLVGSVIEGI